MFGIKLAWRQYGWIQVPMFFRLIELIIAIYYDALGGADSGDDGKRNASDIRKHIEAHAARDGTGSR